MADKGFDKETELYVHIPFCRSKCRFCYYVSFANTGSSVRDSYFSSLEREIAFRWSGLDNSISKINSLYIGGGTPSELSIDEWGKLIRTLAEFWDLGRIREFTVECNPSSLNETKIKAYRASGVNRVSIGLQTLDDELLKQFGREGSCSRLSYLIDSARAAGFDNINCDVLQGLPGEDGNSVLSTLAELIQMQIPHISLYPFVLRKNSLIFSDEPCRELCRDERIERLERFHGAADFLQERGYIRLSCTHFALHRKYESLHHIGYWGGGNVLGFGVSALSFLDGRYVKNVIGLENYINVSPDHLEEFSVTLGEHDIIRRWAMMALSKRLGFSFESVDSKFGPGVLSGLREELDKMCCDGLAVCDDDGIKLTRKGLEKINLIPSMYFKFENKQYLRYIMRLPDSLSRQDASWSNAK